MAESFQDHVEASIFRHEEIKHLYDRGVLSMVTYKVEPWSKEQLEEARQRQQLIMAGNAYDAERYQEVGRDMAENFADHATVRSPSTIVPEAAMKVAKDVIAARAAGTRIGITGFARNSEWSSTNPGEGGSRSAQRALKLYLEANGFSVASTTKHLDSRLAPLEILGYTPVVAEAPVKA